MQIKAGTWRDMTIRLFGKPLPFDRAFEPALNRRIGTAYLAFLQERLLPRQAEWRADERALLLAAYNAGPGRLAESGFNLARMPAQTRDYVARVLAFSVIYDWRMNGKALPLSSRMPKVGQAYQSPKDDSPRKAVLCAVTPAPAATIPAAQP